MPTNRHMTKANNKLVNKFSDVISSGVDISMKQLANTLHIPSTQERSVNDLPATGSRGLMLLQTMLHKQRSNPYQDFLEGTHNKTLCQGQEEYLKVPYKFEPMVISMSETHRFHSWQNFVNDKIIKNDLLSRE